MKYEHEHEQFYNNFFFNSLNFYVTQIYVAHSTSKEHYMSYFFINLIVLLIIKKNN